MCLCESLDVLSKLALYKFYTYTLGAGSDDEAIKSCLGITFFILFEVFTIRSNLHLNSDITSRTFKAFQQKLKLPPARYQLTILTMTGFEV